VSHTLRIISHKLIWDDIIKYDLIKYILEIKDYNIHYQKFAKYQRIYRRNISVGNLRSELPTETFSSVIQSVTTNEIFCP